MVNYEEMLCARPVGQNDIEHSLQERVKELSCLYGCTSIIAQHTDNLDAILAGIAEILPPSWQYPAVTAARIEFRNKTYKTANFRETIWTQTAFIDVAGCRCQIDVVYLEERPPSDEGPFLREERLLIDAIAERIGKIIRTINLNEQLSLERETLQNMNITLREVLKQVEGERRAVESRVQDAVGKVVMPIVYVLQESATTDQRGYLKLLETNLMEITSFTSELSASCVQLTPVEIQICNMIRNGMPTKQIAQLRGISPSTVSNHRENIRKKLNLTRRSINLTTYLLSLPDSNELQAAIPPIKTT